MFILFLGVNKKIEKFDHHNLFLADDWNKHFSQIFDKPQWPDNPSWYLSITSRTDESCAPEGCDNFFVLVPVATGLDDNDDIRQKYAEKIITAIEQVAGEPIRPYIDVKRIYSHRDFTDEYHAWEGTALSIAHTLNQTAVFRPSRKSKKVKNLFYAGHYTHPGVGVPMAFISGDLAAETIEKEIK
jgi:phytoene desaturase